MESGNPWPPRWARGLCLFTRQVAGGACTVGQQHPWSWTVNPKALASEDLLGLGQEGPSMWSHSPPALRSLGFKLLLWGLRAALPGSCLRLRR